MAIILFRRELAFQDCLTPYWLEIDGKLVDRIWTGGKRCMPMAPREYRMRINNGIFNSKYFFAKASDEYELLIQLGPRPLNVPSPRLIRLAWLTRAIRTDSFYEDNIWVKITKLPPNRSFKPNPPRYAIAPDGSGLISASDTTPGGSA